MMNIRNGNIRYETIAVALALLVGLLLRIHHLQDIAVDQFDEGVYSSNLWFANSPGGQYPLRHLYAPPLLPATIEWCQVFLGPTTLASVLPSLLTGWLTIVLVGWLLHRWYGSDAALVGVWLAALSGFHVTYSRMALTDVMLCFFLLAAVGLTVEATVRGGWLRILLAGLATGLAWWTKYNGWLPLAISGSGTAAWLIFDRQRRVSILQAATRWLLIAGVSGAVWSPVWFGLQDKGGYAAVAANHRGYLNPISEWPSSLAQHVISHRVLEGWSTWVSLPVSILAGGILLALLDSRFTWKQIPQGGRASSAFKFVCGLIVTGLAAARIGVSASLLIISVGGLAGNLIWPRRLLEERSSADELLNTDINFQRKQLATWMILAWLIGLLIATPAYRPYPRLTLPLLVSVWLGAAIALTWWVRATRNVVRKSTGPGMSRRWTVVVALGGLSMLAILNAFNPFLVRDKSSRPDGKSLAVVADRMEQQMTDRNFIALTYGEPVLMHLLNSDGHVAYPTASLNTIPGPQPDTEVLVVIGDQARRSAEFATQWAANSQRFESVMVSRFQPSDVVALNDPQDAAQLLQFLKSPKNESPPQTTIEVFRVVAGR